MKTHWPIIRSCLSVTGTYVFILWVASNLSEMVFPIDWWMPVVFGLGLAYTHAFEYFWHCVTLHLGIPGLLSLREGHRRHHVVFHGDNFRSPNMEAPQEIIGHWLVFPLLVIPHYFIFAAVCGLSGHGIEYLEVFFLAVALHFEHYEMSHWFTHQPLDNPYDTGIAWLNTHLPLIGPLIFKMRQDQIEHHRIHHEVPIWNFNFNPFYLGDIFRKTFRRDQLNGWWKFFGVSNQKKKPRT